MRSSAAVSGAGDLGADLGDELMPSLVVRRDGKVGLGISHGNGAQGEAHRKRISRSLSGAPHSAAPERSRELRICGDAALRAGPSSLVALPRSVGPRPAAP